MQQRHSTDWGAREDKLRTLASILGTDRTSLVEDYALDSVVPGICMNDGCDYTGQFEPDQDGGWCEECQMRSVTSALVLAGLI